MHASRYGHCGSSWDLVILDLTLRIIRVDPRVKRPCNPREVLIFLLLFA
jgi:hypothetical protein